MTNEKLPMSDVAPQSMCKVKGFVKAVTQGLLEITEGKEQSLDDVKVKLDLKFSLPEFDMPEN